MKNVDIKKWEASRKRTFIVFCFFLGLTGTEYSIVVPSLLTYLRDVIKVENEKTWFALITTVYWISSVIGNLTITKYADRTRDIKRCFYFGFFVVSLGNFLYTIPFSVVFPFVGRSLQGFANALFTVSFGEVLRVYPEHEAVEKVSILVSSYYITFLIGPVFSLIFSNVDIHLMGIHLTITNLPTLCIGFLWWICIFMNWLFVRNLSKEYDLKAETQKENDLPEEKCEETNKGQMTIKRLLSSNEFRIILSVSFLCAYAGVAYYDVALAFICANYFKMKVQIVAILYSANGIVFLLMLIFVLSKINLQNNEMYVIIGGLAVFVMAIQSLALSALLSQVGYVGISFLGFYTITNGMSWSVEQVLLGVIVAKMIPSRHQSYVEGIRRSLSSLAYIMGGIVTPLLNEYLVEQFNIFSGILFLNIIYLFTSDLKFTPQRV
ncbi:uncharacterized protein [Clytia hemisphaerica]|uniref:uncharacterized protein n=1 Tax=Clytia hemisphaerica TaxID=252671 RepID=UPI0034D4F2A7